MLGRILNLSTQRMINDNTQTIHIGQGSQSCHTKDNQRQHPNNTCWVGFSILPHNGQSTTTPKQYILGRVLNLSTQRTINDNTQTIHIRQGSQSFHTTDNQRQHPNNTYQVGFSIFPQNGQSTATHKQYILGRVLNLSTQRTINDNTQTIHIGQGSQSCHTTDNQRPHPNNTYQVGFSILPHNGQSTTTPKQYILGRVLNLATQRTINDNTQTIHIRQGSQSFHTTDNQRQHPNNTYQVGFSIFPHNGQSTTTLKQYILGRVLNLSTQRTINDNTQTIHVGQDSQFCHTTDNQRPHPNNTYQVGFSIFPHNGQSTTTPKQYILGRVLNIATQRTINDHTQTMHIRQGSQSFHTTDDQRQHPNNTYQVGFSIFPHKGQSTTTHKQYILGRVLNLSTQRTINDHTQTIHIRQGSQSFHTTDNQRPHTNNTYQVGFSIFPHNGQSTTTPKQYILGRVLNLSTQRMINDNTQTIHQVGFSIFPHNGQSTTTPKQYILGRVLNLATQRTINDHTQTIHIRQGSQSFHTTDNQRPHTNNTYQVGFSIFPHNG